MAVEEFKILYQYLTASGTGLYTEIADRLRLFIARQADDNSAKFVVYRPSGGQSDESVPVQRPRVDFFCYGGDEENSRAFTNSAAVEQALRDRLHQATMQTVTDGVLMHAVQVVPAQPQVDERGWPYVVTTYEVVTRAAS